ncbi:hypothetical protein CRENBAI_019151, partial [Crenichthys baileyi]
MLCCDSKHRTQYYLPSTIARRKKIGMKKPRKMTNRSYLRQRRFTVGLPVFHAFLKACEWTLKHRLLLDIFFVVCEKSRTKDCW